METLSRQVRRAQRRLGVQRFLAISKWTCFVTFLVTLLAASADKYFAIGWLASTWQLASAAGVAVANPAVQMAIVAAIWTAVALLLGLVVGALGSWLVRRSPMEAAIELDRRYGLRERVSSTLALSPVERETAIGQALVSDAEHRVSRLDLREKFGFSMDRLSLLPVVPAILAFALAIFWNPVIDPPKAAGTTTTAAQKKQIAKASEELRKKLVERRAKAREEGLKDAEEIFEKLEKNTRELSKSDDVTRDKALVKMNDLARELEQRKADLGGDKLKNQLDRLKDMQQGPAGKLGQALKNGNFEQAKNEMEKIKQQLKEGKLDEKAKQELAKSMSDIDKKLRQLSENQKRRAKDLEKQIAEKTKAGQKKEAAELSKQLAQMKVEMKQMKKLDGLCEKLGQCAQCMKEGDQGAAMAQMDSLQRDLEQLQRELAEMAMLDAALEELGECKDGMCEGNKQSDRVSRSKNATNRGRGAGDRDEEETKTAFYDTKVKQKQGKGAAVIEGFVEGPNSKGQVEQQIQTDFEAIRGGEADPLTNQPLSRGYRDHAREYFEALSGGSK